MCLCCAVARSRVQQCVAVLFFARGVTEESRHLSLSGSALPFPKGVTSGDLRGKDSHSPAPWESRARGPELFALARVVCLQVAPRTCVKCPRAAPREGDATRCSLSTGAVVGLTSRAPVHRSPLEKELVCNLLSVWECCSLSTGATPRSQSVHSTARLPTSSSLMSTSGVVQPLLKRPSTRPGAVQELL